MSVCVKLSLCFLAENQLYFNKLKKKHLRGGEALILLILAPLPLDGLRERTISMSC